jgi:hypothetical protein
MRCCFYVFVILAFTVNLHAGPTEGSAPVKIGADDVTNYFGKEVIFTGTVAQVSIRPKIVFLNMDKPYPDSPFTLVIFPAATNQFGNLKALRGMSVEAEGMVSNYHERAEIVLEKAKQLKVIGPAPTNTAAIH